MCQMRHLLFQYYDETEIRVYGTGLRRGGCQIARGLTATLESCDCAVRDGKHSEQRPPRRKF